jgi:DNA-3-methyladenine glycosylase I
MTRCWWCGDDPLYVAYHDEVWGRPMHGDRALFEMLTLESFQSGLSWITILRKQEGFCRAFAGWDLAAIAAFGDEDRDRLMHDAAIVRNRAKIDAAIANARAVLALHAAGETLDALLWSFAPGGGRAGPGPRAPEEIPTSTAESAAMAKELKRRGFLFFGPTTAYALMQAAGLVDDHLADCAFRGAPG